MWFERGNAWYRSGNIEKALADYEKAAQLAPDDEAYAKAAKEVRAQLHR